MIKKMNNNRSLPKILLLFAATEWSQYTRRPMVSALARTAVKYKCKVVAVNRPLCLLTAIATKRYRFRELFGRPLLKRIDDNLYMYNPKYFIHDEIANRFAPFEKLNLFALRKSYARLQRQLGIIEPKPIIWYNYPHQGYVSRLFPDNYCIYELYDNLSDFDGRESEYVNRLERKYRGRVDLLLTTSRLLHQKHGGDYRSFFYFGNGLDRDLYDRIVAADSSGIDAILDIPSPRIGYAGMISDRLDWNLIGNLAAMKPDWNFVFIGPVADKKIVEGMKGLPNIHFPGKVSPARIASALKAFDIGMLPYRDNPFFHALNPLKFYEMAAAGLPMVSSEIEELKAYPESLVRVLPNNVELWRDAISVFLNSDRLEAVRIGQNIAADHIWDDMTDKLFDCIASNF